MFKICFYIYTNIKLNPIWLYNIKVKKQNPENVENYTYVLGKGEIFLNNAEDLRRHTSISNTCMTIKDFKWQLISYIFMIYILFWKYKDIRGILSLY